MATAFNTSVGSLEDELTQLILDGQISARIDSQKKVQHLIIFYNGCNLFVFREKDNCLRFSGLLHACMLANLRESVPTCNTRNF